MTISPHPLKTEEIIYPDADGQPMAESDPARDYLIYGVEALSIYFQNRADVYVSSNLFIYYRAGVVDAVVAPDVFVVFGVEKKKRRSYKVWEEEEKVPSFVLEVTSKSTQENDEKDKPKKYAQLGVEEYFQYDPSGDYLQPQLKGARLEMGSYKPLTAVMFPDGVLSIRSQVLGLDLRLLGGELRFYDPQTGTRLLSYEEEAQARTEVQQALQQEAQARAEAQQALQQEAQARAEAQQALQQEAQARAEAQQALQQEAQARREAIPQLLELGLSVEQVAGALNLPVEEVRRFVQDDNTKR